MNASLLLLIHYLESESCGLWISSMEFNQNRNSSLKSKEPKKKRLLWVEFNQQGIKTNYNSPTDLSKEKIN